MNVIEISKVAGDSTLQNRENKDLTKQDCTINAVAAKSLTVCAICRAALYGPKAIAEYGFVTVAHPGGEMHPIHAKCLEAALRTNPSMCPICRDPLETADLEESKEGERAEHVKPREVVAPSKLRESLKGPVKPQEVVTPSAPMLQSADLPVPSAPRTASWRSWCCGGGTDVLDTRRPVAVEGAGSVVTVDGQKVVCVFDSKIRNLIVRCGVNEEALKKSNYLDEKKVEMRAELKRQIDERRVYLGLGVEETAWGCLDISYLNLSRLNLEWLFMKYTVNNGTDFSDSILKNIDFSNSDFLDCKMQRTTFINCDFRGVRVSFSKTDMKDAVIDSDCYIERGATWIRMISQGDFKAELSRRGAMNADSVTFIGAHGKVFAT